jgi:restriction system protein
LLAVFLGLMRDRQRARAQAERARVQAQKHAQHQADLNARREREAERARRKHEAEVEQARRRDERQAREAAAVQRRQAERIERELRLRQQQEARERKRQELAERQADAERRTVAVRAQVTAIDSLLTKRRRDLRSHAAPVEAAFNKDGAPQLGVAIWDLIKNSKLPAGFPTEGGAGYEPENRRLLVQRQLPGTSVIPTAQSYRYVKTRDAVEPVSRKDAEARRLYTLLIAHMTLRTLSEAFDATPHTLVDTIAFNGYVESKDKATGRPVRPCLVSLEVARDSFEELFLDEPELDPIACLRHLNALVSPHPYDLEAVRPVVTFDLSRYRFSDEVEVASGLDSRPDLLDLTPVEFEHLIRELFQASGFKSWKTQDSHDDGVDAVAINDDAMAAIKCVIQAKRYNGVVPLESVHALAGAMNDHHASTRHTCHYLLGRSEEPCICNPRRQDSHHRRSGAEVSTEGAPGQGRTHWSDEDS